MELIAQHKSIEQIIENIDKKKYQIPDDWNYKKARELFLNPEVLDPETVEVSRKKTTFFITNFRFTQTSHQFLQLKWTDPDEEGLVAFLCGDRQFNEDRVRNGSKKIMKTRSTSTQGRLDSFFKVLPSATPTTKRKLEDIKRESAKKVKTSSTPKRGGRRGK